MTTSNDDTDAAADETDADMKTMLRHHDPHHHTTTPQPQPPAHVTQGGTHNHRSAQRRT